MQAYSVPCWWVGWWLWRAGCISQDTYLLYYYYIFDHLGVAGLLLTRLQPVLVLLDRHEPLGPAHSVLSRGHEMFHEDMIMYDIMQIAGAC